MNTPKILALLTALLAATTAHAATDCTSAGDSFNSQINDYKSQRDQGSPDDRLSFTNKIQDLYAQQAAAIRSCQDKRQRELDKQADLAAAADECNKKGADPLYKGVYHWDDKRKKCINDSENAANKAAPTSDECSSASIFNGDLKGQNCKAAMNMVKDVRARTGALTDATTAATVGYSNLQATGATGAQDDAQTRQANMMKTLAMGKIATGLLNIANAGQLKSAASGAEDANSTITGAQKEIQSACSKADDDQACFYAQMKSRGYAPDQQAYASYARMKTAASQSQDQADQANNLAKTSMMTGASDLLVGMQAMKAAQMANNNAGLMAPPPVMGMRGPAPTIALAGDSGGVAAPSMEPAATAPPMGGADPAGNINTLGAQHHGHIGGGMGAFHMGAPDVLRAAASGVSGGGGGGGGVGGGALRPSGGPRAPAGRRNSTAGEYNLAGGGPKAPGAAAAADKDNPFADMLAKMFPQGQDGKPVVDQRHIASASGGQVAEDEQADPGVTVADVSIFEQISAKYRQLGNNGRF